jgi:hypothetical protein
MSTERFIHLRNLELLRNRLARTTAKAECGRIMRLIEEEELKDALRTDGHAQRQTSVTLGDAHKARRPAHR